jgi:hypothetical protein
LKGDYEAAVRAKAAGRSKPNSQDIRQSIEAAYAVTAQLADVEVWRWRTISNFLYNNGLHSRFSA